jgi:hypothetical protein
MQDLNYLNWRYKLFEWEVLFNKFNILVYNVDIQKCFLICSFIWSQMLTLTKTRWVRTPSSSLALCFRVFRIWSIKLIAHVVTCAASKSRAIFTHHAVFNSVTTLESCKIFHAIYSIHLKILYAVIKVVTTLKWNSIYVCV